MIAIYFISYKHMIYRPNFIKLNFMEMLIYVKRTPEGLPNIKKYDLKIQKSIAKFLPALDEIVKSTKDYGIMNRPCTPALHPTGLIPFPSVC